MRVPSSGDWRAFLGACRRADRRPALIGVVVGTRVLWRLRRGAAVRELVRAPGPHHRATGADPVARARAIAVAVDAGLGVLPARATCLRRSLVLIHALAREGIRGSLSIGVRRMNGSIEAHAWVCVDGEVVNEAPGVVSTYDLISDGDLERLAVSWR